MTVGVDDVNEKLNGIVNLLQIVGIDGVDPNALVEEQKRLASGKKDGSSAGTGTTAQSSDSQIMEIIKKLQQAQADSPEILQALQSPELLALASLAAQSKAPAPAPAPSLHDVMEDEDDNYPKIGPGYSDEISVVSEMSTPTVMTKQNVNDEEYYSEVGGGAPPMSIGGRPPTSIGGGGGGRGKSRNLLATVSATANRGALAKGGGAAAQRRANYQTTMAKLQEPEKDDKKGKSQKGKVKKTSDKKKKKKDHDDKSKSSKGSKGDGIDWGNSGDDSGWPSFEQFDTTFGEDPFGTSAAKVEKVVDDDGFFTTDVFANVDPFSQQVSAPNASSNSSQASSSKKDGKKKKPKKPKDDGQGTRNRTEKPKEKTKNRRRRASMGM
ncbi:unnamed protein product [Cylindrotheca closterium]|uniref:Uncharacterized protein n=1 Tax=Cylindrotheca closterium TaxID=2856 RepID=A0AAD2G9S3_9STRA|nr:unnamed protein product [Cylindrotheca closterium]